MEQANKPDPGVLYVRYEAPDKNQSVLELKQTPYEPGPQFTAEYREKYPDYYNPKRREPFPVGDSQVELGNDPVYMDYKS